MRMTVHNGRAGKNGVYSPKHNDRQFDISSAEHIDPERMPGNVYWNWTGKNISFEDAVLVCRKKRKHSPYTIYTSQNHKYHAERTKRAIFFL